MKKVIATAGILMMIFFNLQAQKIDSVLTMLNTHFPTEKIYIHYDKEYYVSGETIWFKAYLYNDGKPDAVSNNFYLQFIDAKGNIISTGKYPVVGATARGNISIPDSLPQGNYYIRALTPAMLNNDESFVYKKNIVIFKPGVTPAAAKSSQTVSLQFFPESGYLVDGILTMVAFKAVDQFGIPVEVSGIIKTEDGITVAPFKTYHDGIGRVPFKPLAGKKYIAETETAAGKRQFNLPEVRTSGIVLKVQDEKGGKKFQLARGPKEKEQFENLLLVAQINNHVVYETEIAFEGYPSVIGHLITDSLPSGILHFTVFSDKGVPLAERLSFVNNEEYKVKPDINIVKLGTGKREENIFELSFPDMMQRSFSVSVVDIPGGGLTDKENIYSRFLLTDDLKGYIHNPAWYFNSKTDSTDLAMDNLMLTHGWSRFNWNKILAKEFPEKIFNDESLIKIAGKVVDEKTKAPLTTGKLNVYIEAEDSTTQNQEGILSEQGRFMLDSLVFMGKAKFFYAYTDKQGKAKPALAIPDENEMEKQVIKIPLLIPSEVGEKNLSGLPYNEEIARRYTYTQGFEEKIKELENVDIKSKSSKKPFDIVNEKYTTGVFRTEGKVNLDNINEPANDKSMNVIDYIKNRIQQVEIQGGRFVNRKNMSLMSGQKWVIGLFLNEQPADMGFLRTIRVTDVALVKFYEAGFVGVGSGSPGGALSIYTKEKFMDEQKPDKLSFFEANGYSITKEFYSPSYTTAEAKQIGVDGRTTLYWNSNLFTDMETRTVKLNFYNNDFSKKFKVIVEGFDAAGKLIHLEREIGN